MQTNRPRGTEDLIGTEMAAWHKMQEVAAQVFGAYGYALIETPIFEQTALFVHGIGEATDVVGKEMFSAASPAARAKLIAGEKLKADETLSLRPEGTAGVVRAIEQNGLLPQGGAPVKLMYAGQMFRAERPQKGRLRQFHQIGVECLGAQEASADAEVIIMLMRFFEQLGLPQNSMRLLINSMGDDACRPAYRNTIRDFIRNHSQHLCEECNRRADTNPLRAFDCKNEQCREVMAQAPYITDVLCDDCAKHYATVKQYLDAAGIIYEEDPRLVRGLDYYTHTVFEVQVIDGLGAQNAIGGGGRYNNLMKSIGGKDVPGLGFAVGFERIMLALEAAGVQLGQIQSPCVYVACVDESCRNLAFDILIKLRDAGISAEGDHQGRSLKSQFKQADKLGATYCVVCGPEEAAEGAVTLRNLLTHQQASIAIDAVVAECKE